MSTSNEDPIELQKGLQSMNFHESRLLNLPRELRDQILFEAYRTSQISSRGDPAVIICGVQCALLRYSWVLKGTSLPSGENCILHLVNRQLHDEAERILYSKFTFIFESGLSVQGITTFLLQLSKAARMYLSRVELLGYFPLTTKYYISHQFPPTILAVFKLSEIRILRNFGPTGVVTPFQTWTPNLKSLKLRILPTTPELPIDEDFIFRMRYSLNVIYILNLFKRSDEAKRALIKPQLNVLEDYFIDLSCDPMPHYSSAADIFIFRGRLEFSELNQDSGA
jgi:hypothetical protein